MQPDSLLNDRYRSIYAIDERPYQQLLRARDAQTGALVLLCMLPIPPGQQEATAQVCSQIAALDHPNLIPLSDFFAFDDRYILVAPDPGGQDLERTLRARGGTLAENPTLESCSKVLQLLETLHEQKPPLFIGDLLPSDVVVVGDTWKLLPFALVRLVQSDPSAFRAPELADPNVEPSAASDTYATSALLYYALTGSIPPTSEQLAAGAALQAPRSLNPAVSALAEQALLRALQPKLANRYQNPRELRLALDTVRLMAGRSLGLGPDILRTQQLNTVNANPGVPPEIPSDTPGYGYTIEQEPAKPKRRGLSTGCLVALVAGLAMLVLVIAVAIVLAVAMNGGFARWLPAPTSVATTTQSAAALPLSPNAITAANATTITSTDEITNTMLGPVAFSPAGDRLAVGHGNAISIVDTSMNEQFRLEGHSGDVITVAFSPDGSMLVSAAKDDNAARLWDVATGKEIRAFEGHSDWLRTAVFSPDGRTLATGSLDKTVRLWDVASGRQLSVLEGYGDWVGHVAFSPNGTLLATTARDGSMRLWDIASQRVQATYTAPNNPATNTPYFVTGVAFNDDGSLIAVGSIDGTITLVDGSTAKVIRQLTGIEGFVVLRGLVFAPDGTTLYSAATDGSVRAWNTTTGQQIGEFTGHREVVIGLALSPDGKQLVSSSGDEGTIIFWDTSTYEPLHTYQSGQGLIIGLSYDPQSTILGLTGYNGALKLRSADGKESQLGPAGSSQETLLLNGSRYGVITDQRAVVLLRPDDSQMQALDGLSEQVQKIATNRPGTLLAAGAVGGAVAVWDTDGKQLHTLNTGLPGVFSLALSDDGRYLAVGGTSTASQVLIWDMTTGQQTQTISGLQQGAYSLAFQGGGTLLAGTDGQGQLFIWDATSGQLLNMNAPPSPTSAFLTIAASPDGSLLAVGTSGGEVILLNMADRREITRVDVGDSPVIALAFSPEGSQLAVSVQNEAGSVYLLGIG